MENPEAKSKWDDLVRELAVEIPPEVQQREEAVAAAKPQAAAPPSRHERQRRRAFAEAKCDQLEQPGHRFGPAAVGRAGTDRGRSSSQAGSSEAGFATGAAARTGAGASAGPSAGAQDRERSDRERPPRREQASDRGNAVNARNKGASNPNRAGKTPNKAASKLGRAANAQIETASKPSRAEKDRSKAANNPNLGGKVADNGAGVAAEDVADSGTIKVAAIVAVGAVAVASRIAIVDADREREPEREDRPAPEVREVSAEPTPPQEPQQKPAAVSLWHKIFGSPAEQTAKIVDEPVDEPGSPSDLRNEPRSAGSGFSDAHADDQMQMFDETDEGDRSGESGEC